MWPPVSRKAAGEFSRANHNAFLPKTIILIFKAMTVWLQLLVSLAFCQIGSLSAPLPLEKSEAFLPPLFLWKKVTPKSCIFQPFSSQTGASSAVILISEFPALHFLSGIFGEKIWEIPFNLRGRTHLRLSFFPDRSVEGVVRERVNETAYNPPGVSLNCDLRNAKATGKVI